MAEKLSVIFDSRGDNTVLHALRRLLPNLGGMDVATGVFEVRSFLLFEHLWRDLAKIRILMGDETTKRTKRQIVEGIREVSDILTHCRRSSDNVAELSRRKE